MNKIKSSVCVRVLAAILPLVAACAHAAPYTDGDLTRCVLNMSQFDKCDDDFAAAKTENRIELVIHRSSMGIDSTDPKYASRMKIAGKCGLMWGAYHFLHPGMDPVLQADNFVRALLDARNAAGSDAPKKVFLVLDEEYYGPKHDSLSIHDLIRTINRVKEVTGTTPCIYTGQDFLLEKLRLPVLATADSKLLSQCMLWIARYGEKTDWPDNKVPTPWVMWDLWQYTGDGAGPGGVLLTHTVPALGLLNAELNYFCGDRIELRNTYAQKAWDYTLQRGITYESLKH